MANAARALHWESLDVSGRINLADSHSVCAEIITILQRNYSQETKLAEFLQSVFTDFNRLYTGQLTGYYPCDTIYHDARHIMDVTLAMARLIDGYERTPETLKLGWHKAKLGIVLALFHDAGYIRRTRDTKHKQGAEYTNIHVSRSAKFLAEYLPQIGMSTSVVMAQELVHYTGYEIDFGVDHPLYHTLGCLLGTADLIAQMSDRCYLEKCRDSLFVEFKIGGVAKHRGFAGAPTELYASPEDLLNHTPGFISTTIQHRLDGSFQGVYCYAATYFAGTNLYMDGVAKNYNYICQQISKGGCFILRRQH